MIYTVVYLRKQDKVQFILETMLRKIDAILLAPRMWSLNTLSHQKEPGLLGKNDLFQAHPGNIQDKPGTYLASTGVSKDLRVNLEATLTKNEII